MMEGTGAPVMNAAKVIPLMTWENVLFPGMLLPLHVSDQKSLLLIDRCLDGRGEFGMVLATDDPIRPFQTGTLARIVDYKSQDDGDMTLILTGLQRFTIAEMIDDEPVLRAMIEPHPFTGSTVSKDIDGLAIQARRLFNRCVRLIAAHKGEEAQTMPILPDRVPDMAWAIAAALAIPAEERQRLLEKESPKTLLRTEILYLEALLTDLRQQVEGDG